MLRVQKKAPGFVSGSLSGIFLFPFAVYSSGPVCWNGTYGFASGAHDGKFPSAFAHCGSVITPFAASF